MDVIGWQTSTNVKAPQQTGGKDCGIFTCQFIKCSILGLPLHHWTPVQINCIRKMMVMELVEGKIRGAVQN